jgi:hypothetical protein
MARKKQKQQARDGGKASRAIAIGTVFAWRTRGFGLMISRLQTKDGAALRAWTKRREEIFQTVKLFRGN